MYLFEFKSTLSIEKRPLNQYWKLSSQKLVGFDIRLNIRGWDATLCLTCSTSNIDWLSLHQVMKTFQSTFFFSGAIFSSDHWIPSILEFCNPWNAALIESILGFRSYKQPDLFWSTWLALNHHISCADVISLNSA